MRLGVGPRLAGHRARRRVQICGPRKPNFGLDAHWAALRADGLATLEELKRLHAADHTALASRLGKLGLKMGPRQKLIAALR